MSKAILEIKCIEIIARKRKEKNKEGEKRRVIEIDKGIEIYKLIER